MGTMLKARASSTNSSPSQINEYVARSLDQLEELGRYSVVYEIARIDTMINQVYDSDKHTPPNYSCG